MRLEGDFDVDKLDYWWSTPNKILMKWDRDAGKVIRVNPEETRNKSSLSRGLKLTSAEKVNLWADTQVDAEFIRGQIIGTRRLVDYLEHYSSTDRLFDGDGKHINTFSIDLGESGRIYVDPKKIELNHQKLAEDIQRMTDSDLGFNKSDLKLVHDIKK